YAKQVLETERTDHAALKSRLETQSGMMRELEKEITETEKNITISDVQRQNLLQEKERGESEFLSNQEEHARLQQQLNSLRTEEELKKEQVLELTAADDALQQQIN